MAVSVPHHPYFRRPVNPSQAAARRHRPVSNPSNLDAPPVNWVLLDRRVAILDSPFPFLLPALASAATGEGHEVRIYLASPPALSLALLLDGEASDRNGWRKPSLLAADEGRLLLRIPSPASLLLFTAAVEPSLVILPERPGTISAFASRGAGLLSDGEEYVVAFMMASPTYSGGNQREIATVSMFSSGSESWVTRQMDMPSPASADIWRLDASVSFGNCITWADFSRGLITCDVLDEDPSLYFMALPRVSHPSESRLSWMFSTICVSNDLLRFLCVTRGPNQNNFSVAIWTLDQQGYRWRQEGGVILTSAHMPKCPMLSGEDPNVLYFLLQQGSTKYVYKIRWTTMDILGRYPFVEDLARGGASDTPYIGSEIAMHIGNPPEFTEWPLDGGNDGLMIQELPALLDQRKARKTD